MTDWSWLQVTPWLLPFLALPLMLFRRPLLRSFKPLPQLPVSVIIPARNESANIARLLQSLCRTEHAEAEFLVIDDCSSDDTASIVTEFAARDPRVRLVAGTELPQGWLGKPWACVQGYRQARHPVLLFTDADTVHQPWLMSFAAGALQQSGAGLVTVMPHQVCLGFWERVIMPHVWLLLGLRFHPWLVNRSRRVSNVIANGQFIMVSRDSYQAAGTHEAVRGEVAEDLALAQEFRRKGIKLLLAFATDQMTTRMYRDLPGLIEGWSKNLYLGGVKSLEGRPLLQRIVPTLLVLPTLFWLAPVAALLVAPVSGFYQAPFAAVIASAVFWAIVSLVMRIPPVYGLAFPVGAAMYGYITLRSLVRGRKRIEWRGRTYDLS